jgi:hypothetical protein
MGTLAGFLLLALIVGAILWNRWGVLRSRRYARRRDEDGHQSSTR